MNQKLQVGGVTDKGEIQASLLNIMWQLKASMFMNVVKAYIHKLSGSDIQLIPAAEGQAQACTTRWVMRMC